MTGYDEKLQRRKAMQWQRYFEALGHEVINPYALADGLYLSFRKLGGKEPGYADYLQEDLMNLKTCTHIFFCLGWTESNGCMEECDESIKLNLKFMFENKYETWKHTN